MNKNETIQLAAQLLKDMSIDDIQDILAHYSKINRPQKLPKQETVGKESWYYKVTDVKTILEDKDKEIEQLKTKQAQLQKELEQTRLERTHYKNETTRLSKMMRKMTEEAKVLQRIKDDAEKALAYFNTLIPSSE
jgi:predicted RNase H-like nuclease (RuvC/YqgF family)